MLTFVVKSIITKETTLRMIVGKIERNKDTWASFIYAKKNSKVY